MKNENVASFGDVRVKLSFDLSEQLRIEFLTDEQWIKDRLEKIEGFCSNGKGATTVDKYGEHRFNFSAFDSDFARKYYGEKAEINEKAEEIPNSKYIAQIVAKITRFHDQPNNSVAQLYEELNDLIESIKNARLPAEIPVDPDAKKRDYRGVISGVISKMLDERDTYGSKNSPCQKAVEELNDYFLSVICNIEHYENKPSVAEAVNVLTDALRADKDFYFGYQSNIAMAFVDEVHRAVTQTGKKTTFKQINRVANIAAKNFMDLWLSQAGQSGCDQSEPEQAKAESSDRSEPGKPISSAAPKPLQNCPFCDSKCGQLHKMDGKEIVKCLACNRVCPVNGAYFTVEEWQNLEGWKTSAAAPQVSSISDSVGGELTQETKDKIKTNFIADLIIEKLNEIRQKSFEREAQNSFSENPANPSNSFSPEEILKMSDELASIDAALARRDALDGLPNRYKKIQFLCAENQRMEDTLRKIKREANRDVSGNSADAA